MFASRNVIILTILFAFYCLFSVNLHNGNSFAAEQPASNPAAVGEYLKLRLDYSKSEEYNPYNPEITDIRGQCIKLMDEEKFKEVIEKAKQGLEKDKYNIQLLICLAISYRKIGDIENADKYRKMWTGLVDSILTSGDGKSSETAFRVISVGEEYAVLNVLKLEVISQKLVTIQGSDFDIFETVKSGRNEKITLYFNVDIPFKWLVKKNEAGTVKK